jgi:hypothetical protein
VVEECNQLICAINDSAAPRSDIGVCLAFHGLPAIRPEPGLVGRHRDDGHELDAAVAMVDQPDLRLRPIEVQPMPEVRGKGQGAPGSNGDRYVFMVAA